MKKNNNKMMIWFEKISLGLIFIIILVFIIKLLHLYYIYNIIGAMEYYEIVKPVPLTHEELVELLKSKGINACKEWPREYPMDSEKPCFIKGIDKDGDKYCDVFCTEEQSPNHKTVHLCRDFWDFIKNRPDL